MSSFDMISMAVRNLLKRKLRTFLTVLGVIIGTASIVVMISVGIGMNQGYKEQIEQMGSLNVITVNKPWGGGMMNEGVANKGEVNLDKKTIETISNIAGVEIVTPIINEYLRLIDGRYVSDVSVVGILPEAMEAMGYKVASGRALQEGDSMDMVLGAYAKDEFFNPKLSWQYRWNSKEPIEIDIENDKFQITYDYSYGEKHQDKSIKAKRINIVGVLDQEANDSWSSVMPIEQVEKIKAEKDKKFNNQGNQKSKKGVYDTVKVRVADLKDVTRVQEEIKNMGFEAYSLMEYLNAMQETSKMLQMVLGAIGAVSLLVAAIGITNTMVMSIYERTKEIGVMKVIGATLPDIKRLFLTEAAFIGFFGGILGVIFSYGASMVVNIIAANMGQASKLSLIPPWLALLSIAFATFIGITSGYFPARRAMKLSALSAIRTE